MADLRWHTSLRVPMKRPSNGWTGSCTKIPERRPSSASTDTRLPLVVILAASKRATNASGPIASCGPAALWPGWNDSTRPKSSPFTSMACAKPGCRRSEGSTSARGPTPRHVTSAGLRKSGRSLADGLPTGPNRNTATALILQDFSAALRQHIRHSIRKRPAITQQAAERRKERRLVLEGGGRLRRLCAPGLVRQERLRADCADAWLHRSSPSGVPGGKKKTAPGLGRSRGG